MSKTTPQLKSVRGKGALLAIELDLERLSAVDDDALLAALRDEGVSTTTKGDDAIGISLPLIISDAEVEMALGAIQRVVGRLGERP
jgi:4-aminobutyrate aminotransferase